VDRRTVEQSRSESEDGSGCRNQWNDGDGQLYPIMDDDHVSMVRTYATAQQNQLGLFSTFKTKLSALLLEDVFGSISGRSLVDAEGRGG